MVDHHLAGTHHAAHGRTAGGTQSNEDVRSNPVLAVRGVIARRLDLVRVAVARQRPEGSHFGRRSMPEDAPAAADRGGPAADGAPDPRPR